MADVNVNVTFSLVLIFYNHQMCGNTPICAHCHILLLLHTCDLYENLVCNYIVLYENIPHTNWNTSSRTIVDTDA